MTNPLSLELSKRFSKSELAGLAGIVILAGGLSTRMGSPKALLTLPSGRSLLDYHVQRARQFGVPILIADNAQGFSTQVEDAVTSLIHVEDYQPQSSHADAKHKHSAGPLGAILSAMQQLLKQPVIDETVLTNASDISQWMLVVSCDSLVSANDIWKQVTEFIETTTQPVVDASQRDVMQTAYPQVYCLTDNERMYPLLGLYELGVAETLQAYLDAGERRVMEFIKSICQHVAMPEAWYALSNLNTPEQFKQACQSLPS
ncbi:molybdenum cofactor guanylyltransferase [Psychrobacter sanguinis]|uniref:molybdenum cofactor guanylyltransferase n=1 Tax=Psychrobacter sanguinis TaxID=861445 RepID=UPI00191B4436|nr:molybdenum cofactor guanylyltransferase [Psychrobacter sanguinis]MCC3345946.1 molybdenum cofactor guanylyltransferase [Psychrobacter sanguinis]